MYGVSSSRCRINDPPSHAQRYALERWAEKAATLILLLRLAGRQSQTGAHASAPVTLVAAEVDVLPRYSQVNPKLHMPAEVWAFISKPERIWPSIPRSLRKIPVFQGDLSQYATLVAVQCRAHRVRLRFSVIAGGSTFLLAKPNRSQLRQLWNGHLVSSSAVHPPRPPAMANPGCFVHVRASHSSPLYLSSRDFRAWLDQLELPSELSPYLAQSPIPLRDWLTCGFMLVVGQTHLPSSIGLASGFHLQPICGAIDSPFAD